MTIYNDLESEKTLICQMVLDNSVIPNIYEKVKPEHFTAESYKRCYEKIKRLVEDNIPVDQVVFTRECSDILTLKGIADIQNATYTASNWDFYATKVKDAFVNRSLKAIMDIASDNLREAEMKPENILSDMMTRLAEISGSSSACIVHSLASIMSKVSTKIQAAMDAKSQYTGIPTGIDSLDEIISGIQKEYIVIGARPSIGKTALALQIATEISKTHKVDFFELEMDEVSMGERMVASQVGLGLNRIRSGIFTTGAFSKMTGAMLRMPETMQLNIVTCNTRSIQDIVSKIRQRVRNDGVEVVFIDHFGLINAGKDSGRGKDFEVGRVVSNEIQKLQRELKVPIVVLSQVGRDSEGKAPTLAELRRTGAIEEDADTIIFIDRPRQIETGNAPVNAKLVVAKNRNGSLGAAKCTFYPDLTLFRSGWATESEIHTEE